MKEYKRVFKETMSWEDEVRYHDEALNIWDKYFKIYGHKYLPQDPKFEGGHMIIENRFPITMRQQLKEIVEDFRSVYGKNVSVYPGKIIIYLNLFH